MTTVSGNPPSGSVFDIKSEDSVQFSALSPEEQRLVAERLLKMKESDWKPFWCPDKKCGGDPHPAKGPLGDLIYVSQSDKAGPNGEPVADLYGPEDGVATGKARPVLDPTKIAPGEEYLGRVILDPTWAHNHARVDQRLPPWKQPWNLFIMSGRGCVAPWTLIDLADGTRERIDVLADRGVAVEVMTPDGPRWTEGAPFLKGEAHMWRVRLSTGRVLTVTDEHRFLAPGGWLRLDHVRVGQPLVAAALARSSSVGRLWHGVLSEWREGVQRCWGTELSSGCGCRTCRRRSDLPPPLFPETDLRTAPSQGGASEPCCGSSVVDDRGQGRGCSPTCPHSAHQTRSRSARGEPSQAVGPDRDVPSLDGLSPRTLQTAVTSHESSSLRPPTHAGPTLREGQPVGPSPVRSRLLRAAASLRSGLTRRVQSQDLERSATRSRIERSDLVWVESIEYSHFGPYFDMSVPGPQSYISEGVVNHNTGKTRTGVEFVTLHARKGLDGAILGRRGTELINTHVKEILKFAHPEFTPIHWASKDILEWPNGAITYLFSAEKPENIRSINISYYWIDEAAFMEFIRPAHNNLKLATRIETEENPKHVLITSTPTSTPWVMECEQNPDYEIRRVSTYANRANLGVSYLADLVKDLEGTRIGRQELHGEVLRDVEGALWNDDMFNHLKITDAAEFVDLCESMDDIVVAVDPAGTANKRSDETGIIAVGVQHTDEDGNRMSVSKFYVLADGTIKGTPTEWARRVYDVARIVRARRIVAEKNFGADMVKQVLTDFAKLSPEEAESVDGDNMSDLIEEADARQSKETRAESTVGKYEQGRVTHVPNSTAYGDLSTLEKEQTTWVPRSRGGKAPSPNRIDAIVWAVRALEKAIKYEGAMAGSRTVQERTTPHQAGQPRPDWLGAAITLPDIPPSREREPRTIQAPMRPSRERTAAPAAAVADSKKWPAKPRLAKTGTTKRPAGVHRR